MNVAVCLLRDNLRLADNLALREAAAGGRPTLPVFVLDDDSPGRWRPGGAARWWLRRSLASLADSLERRGSRLTLLRGETAAALAGLLAACPADSLHLQRGYAPWDPELEARLRALCGRTGVELRLWDDRLLFPPEAARTAQGGPFRVFTPFWRRCLALGPPAPPVPSPRRLAAPRRWPASLRLEELGLPTERAAWTEGLEEAWTPGEAGTRARLRAFLRRGAAGYASGRDRPDLADGVSRLSPHLRFGEIGARAVWHAAAAAPGADAFLRQLGWREFSSHLLHHFPDLPGREFRPAFRDFPWRKDPEALRAWRRGRTGYPMVDAGMRQLRRSGWMHNRARMIAASFLAKNLLVDWRAGQNWFWDNLVDADLANNAVGWQWAAGCGPDAAPYFRIFNPALQGRRFDPRGGYVRAHVPELEGVDAARIHEPRPEDRAVGGYPGPMVPFQETRRRALAVFRDRGRGGTAKREKG